MIDPSVVQESIRNNESIPTSTLGIRNIWQNILKNTINVTSTKIPKDKHIHLSLIDSARKIVVSSRPQSLYGLEERSRRLKPTPRLDQYRIPFSKRKFNFTTSFLPNTDPSHSPHLVDAYTIITADISDSTIASICLILSIYRTDTRKYLRSEDRERAMPEIVRMITCNAMYWRKATHFSKSNPYSIFRSRSFPRNWSHDSRRPGGQWRAYDRGSYW